MIVAEKKSLEEWIATSVAAAGGIATAPCWKRFHFARRSPEIHCIGNTWTRIAAETTSGGLVTHLTSKQITPIGNSDMTSLIYSRTFTISIVSDGGTNA